MPIQNLVPTIDVGALAQSTVRVAAEMREMLGRERIHDIAAQQNQQRIDIEQASTQAQIQRSSILDAQTKAQTEGLKLQQDLFREELPIRMQEIELRKSELIMQQGIAQARSTVGNMEMLKQAAILGDVKRVAELNNSSRELQEQSSVITSQENIRRAMTDNPLLSEYQNKIRQLDTAKESNPAMALQLTHELLQMRPGIDPTIKEMTKQADLIDQINKSRGKPSTVGDELRKSLVSPMDMDAGILGSRHWVMNPKTGQMMRDRTPGMTIGQVVTGLMNNDLEANKVVHNTYLGIRDEQGQKDYVNAIHNLLGPDKKFAFDPISHKQRIESIIDSHVKDSDLPFRFFNRFGTTEEKRNFGIPDPLELLQQKFGSAATQERIAFNKRIRGLEGKTVGEALTESESIINDLRRTIAGVTGQKDYDTGHFVELNDQLQRAFGAQQYLTKIASTRHMLLSRGNDYMLDEAGLATGQFRSAADAITFAARGIAMKRRALNPGAPVDINDWEDPGIVDEAEMLVSSKKWIRKIN